jgi:long-chain acyl-CoA synthetase
MATITRDVAAERAEMLGAIEGKTLLTLLSDMAEKLGDQPALKWKEGDGWRSLSWRQYREAVLDAAAGLRSLGFKPGDFSLIMSRNRPEAVIADLATLHARGISVHLYNTLPPEQVEYIANHCEASFALLEDGGFMAKFDAIRDRLPHLRRTVLFDAAGTDKGVTSWDELLAAGRAERERNPDSAEAAVREVRPDDVATVIYTSGTTGPPKGVMDTHAAILYMEEATERFGDYTSDMRTISYLPLAHATGRALDIWGPLRMGGAIHFCPDPLQLVQYSLEVHPHVLISVPRVWEKLHALLAAGIAAIPDPQTKAAIQGAVEAGRQVVRLRQRGEEVPQSLQDAYDRAAPVRRSLLGKVGLEECRIAVTGAAPIDPAIIEFFQALGIGMGEAWGMTEVTCATTASHLDRVRNGKVGYAFPGMEMTVAWDGEVLIRGPLLMKGYYKDPEKTAETIDADGWLHTGDVGEIDADGYLKIIDRKKELIITSGGKNISPSNIEYLLKAHDIIGQAMAIGDRRNYITALLVLDPMTAPVWATQHGIDASSLDELAHHPQVLAEVQRAVDEANEHLARVEQVKRFVLLSEQWTPETGELTPSMKLKRRVVLEHQAGAIEAMYAD